MKFQKNKKTVQKLQRGTDGRTDRRTDRRTDGPTDGHYGLDRSMPDLKTMGLQKNQLRGAKYILCGRI